MMPGTLDAEHVELALEVTEDEVSPPRYDGILPPRCGKPDSFQ
jgi:hypothetical protein